MPLCQEAKRGDKTIDLIKYLPRAHMIAFLFDNKIQIVTSQDLKMVQEFKGRKFYTFCLNSAVYRPKDEGGIGSGTDQICVCTTNNELFFYLVD